MTNKQIIQKTAKHVEKKLSGEGTGHDWYHIQRVWRNAILIGKGEKANMLVVELAALLHDISDWKFNNGDDSVGPELANKYLQKMKLDQDIITNICKIIKDISFKGAKVKSNMDTIESKIVQDADRLDAIGAIGVARCFAYGGYKGSEIYNPTIKPILHDSFEKYKNRKEDCLKKTQIYGAIFEAVLS